VAHLTGELAGVERSAQLVIQPGEPPAAVEILQFSAAPSTVEAGQGATLRYRLTNARAARIEPGVGVLPSPVAGTVEVKPREATTYSLEATGSDCRTVQQTVVVNVIRLRHWSLDNRIPPPNYTPFRPPAANPVVPKTPSHEGSSPDVRPTPTASPPPSIH
jgi:hypothetical protein